MKQPHYPINDIIQKINQASIDQVELTLTVEEVTILSTSIGKFRTVPLYSMEQLSEKLRQEKLEDK